MNTKVNDLSLNKLCFVCLLYMGVLQRDPIPKLCFAMGLTICKDLFADCKDFLYICHDLTDMSCPRLTPLMYMHHPTYGRKEMFYLTTHSTCLFCQPGSEM